MLGHEIRGLEVGKKEIKFSNGSKLCFDRCLLATGSRPRRLDVPGETLGMVFKLRSYADCRDLRSVIGNASRAVAVGSGFLGMEVAASLADGEYTWLWFPQIHIHWSRL